jgi:hypothetical protein
LGERLLEAAYRPVDSASLAVFRIALGAILCWEAVRFFTHGWIEKTYLAPVMHFTYRGFEWVRPWPGSGMYVHFIVLAIAALMVMVGWRYRFAVSVLFLGWTYVFLLEKVEYLNHLYWVCLLCFLMQFVPAHAAASVDAWRDPRLRSARVPAWTLWLLRFQVGIPYFFGGIAKLQGDWLQGLPLEIWMARMQHVLDFAPFLASHAAALAFSYGGLLLDLAIVPLLLWRRTRWPAFWLATAFHLMNALMFRIGIFPWMMIAATTLFLPPDWPHRWRLLPIAPPEPRKSAPPPRSAAVLACLGVWIAIQCLLPLRHFLFPGNVNWTERQGRFTWRMMLSDKTGILQFTVYDPKTRKSQMLDPRALLTPRQLDKMKQYPDLIFEFGRFVGEQLRQAGKPQDEVRVYALISLNGRRPQLEIDPQLNLATVAPSEEYRYILPLTEPLVRPLWISPPPEWPAQMGTLPGR